MRRLRALGETEQSETVRQDHYGELESRLAAVTGERDAALAFIKDVERRMADLALVQKHVSAYRQLKPLYDRYRQSKDKEKFLRGHESEIILFEASARELKKLGAVPLPSAEGMKKELADLAARKEALYAEYTAARSGAKEYETIKRMLI